MASSVSVLTGFDVIYQAKSHNMAFDQAWEAVFHHQLKIRRAAEYFWRTSRCFIWWWKTVSNAWYYFSNKMILEEEIKDAELTSFSFDF